MCVYNLQTHFLQHVLLLIEVRHCTVLKHLFPSNRSGYCLLLRRYVSCLLMRFLLFVFSLLALLSDPMSCHPSILASFDFLHLLHMCVVVLSSHFPHFALILQALRTDHNHFVPIDCSCIPSSLACLQELFHMNCTHQLRLFWKATWGCSDIFGLNIIGYKLKI